MNGINNLLVKTDHFCDCTPFSPITNLVNLFLKCVVLPFVGKTTIESNHYYKHMNEKSFIRCFSLLIPGAGIIVGIYDFSKKKRDHIKIESPNGPPSPPIKTPPKTNKGNIRLLEKDANKEIRVPIGNPFSIELFYSPSTGHHSWEISQIPSFINLVDKYVNYQDHDPDCCGDGDDYGFVFEPKTSGTGSIIMKMPCFDERRTVEKTFTIIAK